jgi:hypothetical protein
MIIFVMQTLQKKWNKIHMEQLASGKRIENNYFPRTLTFEIMAALPLHGIVTTQGIMPPGTTPN